MDAILQGSLLASICLRPGLVELLHKLGITLECRRISHLLDSQVAAGTDDPGDVKEVVVVR